MKLVAQPLQPPLNVLVFRFAAATALDLIAGDHGIRGVGTLVDNHQRGDAGTGHTAGGNVASFINPRAVGFLAALPISLRQAPGAVGDGHQFLAPLVLS